jgi:hypothetical protein
VLIESDLDIFGNVSCFLQLHVLPLVHDSIIYSIKIQLRYSGYGFRHRLATKRRSVLQNHAGLVHRNSLHYVLEGSIVSDLSPSTTTYPYFYVPFHRMCPQNASKFFQQKLIDIYHLCADI